MTRYIVTEGQGVESASFQIKNYLVVDTQRPEDRDDAITSLCEVAMCVCYSKVEADTIAAALNRVDDLEDYAGEYS